MNKKMESLSLPKEHHQCKSNLQLQDPKVKDSVAICTFPEVHRNNLTYLNLQLNLSMKSMRRTRQEFPKAKLKPKSLSKRNPFRERTNKGEKSTRCDKTVAEDYSLRATVAHLPEKRRLGQYLWGQETKYTQLLQVNLLYSTSTNF